MKSVGDDFAGIDRRTLRTPIQLQVEEGRIAPHRRKCGRRGLDAVEHR